MAAFKEFIPKSYECLKNYTLSLFKKDLLAGITVGIIALPLAMAFAIASGVGPERGLYTAVIAGFLISALGGSRVQIGGPTGAFVVLVYDIVQRSGYNGLCVATLIGAVLLLLMGVFRLGSWIKYVPHPLITGFTSGIALIIFSSQIKDFFGLQMGTPPAGFIEKWIAYFEACCAFEPMTLAIGAGTLAIILLIRRYAPWLPWGIASIVLATCAAYFLHLPVPTVFSRFGEIPHTLPVPSLPSFSISLQTFQDTFMDGIAIAFLGGIESLLSAVIADGMTGHRHRSNIELIGQGIANIGVVLFGGIPATGAIARTAANIKTGAQTPVAGMIHAVVLFLILFCFSPLVSKVPLAALAAVLIMVAWNMSEAHHFVRLLKAPAGDRAILLTGFLLTVFVDITAAIMLGMILASFLFMKRMSEAAKTVSLTQVFQENGTEERDPDAIFRKVIPPGVEVYEIQGPFFFGAADMLKELTQGTEKVPKVCILRMRAVPLIDASGMHALKEFHDRCKKQNTHLLLSGVHGQTAKDLKHFGFEKAIGKDSIFPHIDAALAHAAKLIEKEKP
ncbi:MAG: sulfate permease [Verrucomicrobiota bacterium]|nr:sulfate permease [Verrucomicrobiota bacterium]